MGFGDEGISNGASGTTGAPTTEPVTTPCPTSDEPTTDPPTTAPPTTAPPTTAPPTTAPPTTAPPTTAPPTTAPPTTAPPTTAPPTTAPPTTAPPTTAPPTTAPPTTAPPTTAPPTTAPPTTAPPTTAPPTTAPPTTAPPTTAPPTTAPVTTPCPTTPDPATPIPTTPVVTTPCPSSPSPTAPPPTTPSPSSPTPTTEPPPPSTFPPPTTPPVCNDHFRPQSTHACPARGERDRNYIGWLKFIDRDLTKGLTQFIQSRTNNDDESCLSDECTCKDDLNAIATDWANCPLSVDNPLEPWTCLRAPFEDPSCVAAALTNNPFNTTRGLASPSLYLKPDNCRRTCAFSYTWRELWVEESPYKGRVLHCSSGIDKKPPRGGDTSGATPNQFHCEGKVSLAATGDDILVDVSVGPSASIVVHDLYIANPASVFHMPGYKDTHQTHLWLSSESWKIQDLFDVSSTVGAFNELDIPPADQVTFWRWKLENETSWHDWRANENVPLTCFATTIQFEAWTYCGAKLTDFSWTVYRHGHDRLDYLSTWFHSIWAYEKEPHCNIPHRDYSVIHLRPHPFHTNNDHDNDDGDESLEHPKFRVDSLTCRWRYESKETSQDFEVDLLSEDAFAIALQETDVTTIHVDCDVFYHDVSGKLSSTKQSRSFDFERCTDVPPATSSCRETCARGSLLNPERRRPLPGQACGGNLVYESDDATIFYNHAELACCSKCTYKTVKCLPTSIESISNCREHTKRDAYPGKTKEYSDYKPTGFPDDDDDYTKRDNDYDSDDRPGLPPTAIIIVPLPDKGINDGYNAPPQKSPYVARTPCPNDILSAPPQYQTRPPDAPYPPANNYPWPSYPPVSNYPSPPPTTYAPSYPWNNYPPRPPINYPTPPSPPPADDYPFPPTTTYPPRPPVYVYPAANTAPSNPPANAAAFEPTQSSGSKVDAVVMGSAVAVVVVAIFVSVLIVLRMRRRQEKPPTDGNYRELK
ncbi:unnamed protein product [Aphanomyces euteiches]